MRPSESDSAADADHHVSSLPPHTDLGVAIANDKDQVDLEHNNDANALANLHPEVMEKLAQCTAPKQAFKLFEAASITPEHASKMLFEANKAVDATQLGSWIGNHHEFWQKVAVQYPKHFDMFRGMTVVEAIRTYLWRFRLPGESAQIERIMSGFSAAYYDLNNDGEVTSPRQNDSGWYVRQPTDAKAKPCCVHCGSFENIQCCQGCQAIHFCRPCIKLASRHGHAAVGHIGHGRACAVAREVQGLPQLFTSGAWPRKSPFKSADSVFVLAYSIIMLTTNLHSVKVKEKMDQASFIRQNKSINDGSNFPGDFLSEVYDDIARDELKVMTA
eukprot:m.108963 g.108963  ORF g.108963 m.108963 type:complete len:330 (+) comp27921_c0_seq1:76-1065(+)